MDQESLQGRVQLESCVGSKGGQKVGGSPTHSYKKDWVKSFIAADDPGVRVLRE